MIFLQVSSNCSGRLPQRCFALAAILVFSNSLLAQNLPRNNALGGIPFVHSYKTRDYRAVSQNWASIQNKAGIIYIGNTEGLLRYDGARWQTIQVPGNAVRCFGKDPDGRIYAGTVNDFGYIDDTHGEAQYRSLTTYLPTQEKNLNDVWTVIPANRGLFVHYGSKIFLFQRTVSEGKNYFSQVFNKPKLKIWRSNTRFLKIFEVDRNIFIAHLRQGLQILDGDSMRVVPGTEPLSNEVVMLLLPWNRADGGKELLIGTRGNAFYKWSGSSLIKFATEADRYLISAGLYFAAAALPDGNFAVGTLKGGIVFIDRQGRLKSIITKEQGLNDDEVHDLMVDREGNLWASLNNGISKLLTSVPVFLMKEWQELNGVITSLVKHEEKLFISTHSGVYSCDINGAGSLHRYAEIVEKAWELVPDGKDLLIPCLNNIYRVTNNVVSIVTANFRNAYTIHPSTFDQRFYFVGTHDGAFVFRKDGETFVNCGKMNIESTIIQVIEEDEDGSLWLQNFQGDLLNVIPPVNKSDANKYLCDKVIQSNDSLSWQIFPYDNKVYFYSEDKFFRYDKALKAPVVDPHFPVLGKEKYSIYSVVPAADKSIWVTYKSANAPYLARLLPTAQAFRIERHPDLFMVFNYYSPSAISVFPSVGIPDAQTVWVGVDDELITFRNAGKNQSQPTTIPPVIAKIEIKDNPPYYPANGTAPLEIAYASNTVVFKYSLTSFINEHQNQYSVFLDGFDDDWSTWHPQAEKEYTNLPPGEYTFRVKGMNALGFTGEAAHVQILVLPPWYSRWWFTLISILVILYLLAYAIRYRVQYLEKKNLELEKVIDDRTAHIRRQNVQLEAQAKQLKELDTQKSNFFANISHEFRTPLTMIMGQVEQFLDSVQDSSMLGKLKSIKRNLDKLYKLINQILELSRLRSGMVRLSPETQNLEYYLRHVVSSFELMAEQLNITLNFHCESEELFAEIDPERFQEVINNLLSNAIKFTPAGGNVDVVLSETVVESKNVISIVVKDTGPGINPVELPKIFDRFYQADSLTEKEVVGSGLGLSIVKELVELHHGTVAVESVIEKGTAFTILLPAAAGSNPLDSAIEKESPNGKRLALIVEDNLDLRSFVKDVLSPKLRLLEAANGEDGIARAIEFLPDIVITDVVMPKKNGFELCAELKMDHRTSHIPVIMLTARTDEESKLDGLAQGADDYISKPFSPRELILRVQNILNSRDKLRERYQKISVIRAEDVECNSVDKAFLDKVFAEVKAHLEDEQFGVDKLAESVAMSPTHLNRKLNQLINQTAGKLIRHSKLDYAAALLEKQAGNISEIAFRIGFSDVSNFTHSFKEKFGVTPSEYAKSIK